MRRTGQWVAAMAIAVGLGLSLAGCGQPATTTTNAASPIKVETVAGSSAKRLTLTDKAVKRLSITTSAVTADGSRLLIPYAALLYLPDGKTITYTNPEGTTYLREPVTVESIRGDQVVLTAGPKVGTQVVTTGGAELWGAEFGIK
jgi:multidrug efflux pump subunit AcrA (membrane-fusion protein)